LAIPGVDIFYRNHLCQDILENFFGQQRNTSESKLCTVYKNMQAFRVINTTRASQIAGKVKRITVLRTLL